MAAAADTFDLMTDGDVAGAERRRLREADAGVPWRRWGPYVSARQWGTVREDDSPDGAAWFAVTHPRTSPPPVSGDPPRRCRGRSRSPRDGRDRLAGPTGDRRGGHLAVAAPTWPPAPAGPSPSPTCRRRPGRRRAAGRGRGVAHGRLGAQPGGDGDRRAGPGSDRFVPRALPDLRARRHGRLAVLRPALRGRRAPRRPSRLAAAREELADAGAPLLLDFVPNHVAPDHPWVPRAPGTSSAARPTTAPTTRRRSFDAGGEVLARGRDPYFPPWPDVAPARRLRPGLRRRPRTTLIDIGDQCDGVRCDMAMLLLNDIFERDLGRPGRRRARRRVLADGDRRGAGARIPTSSSWPRPTGIWSGELQQLGFDACYDKRLYDRLVHERAASVRAHLRRRPRLPAPAGAVHREPRRAPGGGRAPG